MHTQSIAPLPITAVLAGAARAWRRNGVDYTSVPDDCRPPRITLQFANGGEVRDFAAGIQRLAEDLPAGEAEPLYRVLGEIVACGTVHHRGAAVDPDVLQQLLAQLARDLMTVVQVHGPVTELRPSPYLHRKLVTIAALAVAGALKWDGEHGQTDGAAPEPIWQPDPCPALAAAGGEC